MKKYLLGLCLVFISAYAFNQGLNGIIVEKYYISTAADAAKSSGVLPVGSVTYRFYVDMQPDYKFKSAFGITSPAHELKFTTTTSFYNHEDRGDIYGNLIGHNRLATNTVMLDSWLSIGGASSTDIGIMKSEDDLVGNIVNADGILQNNNPKMGDPLTLHDGLIAGTPQAPSVTPTLAAKLNAVFFNTNGPTQNSLLLTDDAWASSAGVIGP